jgi:hypothetical protein
VDIFHIERNVGILNSPSNYGVRLEFLDIEITVGEQLAFFAERERKYELLAKNLEKLEKIFLKNNVSNETANEDFEFEMRTDEVISEVIGELLDKIWYERHLV